MRKLVVIVLALLLMTGVLVLPAAGQDASHALAQYFPGETPLYFEFRTDDGFIETIDDLAAKIDGLVPDAEINQTFREALDDEIQNLYADGSFAENVRPWLGDVGAVGLYTLDEESLEADIPPILVVISITDEAGATSFFTDLPEMDDYSSEAGDGYTLYSPDGMNPDEPFVVIRSDAVILTSSTEIAQAGGVIDSPLSEQPIFASTLDALPLDSYDASAYFDTPTVFELIMSESDDFGMDEAAMLSPMLAVLQPQAFGFALLDGRSLVFDAASPIDTDADLDLPLTMPVTEPIDPAFAHYLPASTALVIQGTNLYQSYQYGVEAIRQFGEMMSENDADFEMQDLEMMLFALNFGVRGLTGLDTDAAFGWMTGDYALTLGLSPAFADANSVMAAANALPVDFGLVFEATDNDAVQALFDGLSESMSELESEEVTAEVTGDAIHLTFTPEDSPFPIEITISMSDDVFAFGTERAVRSAIQPANGLDSDAAYTDASAYFLDGMNALLYVSSSGLTPLARVMSASGNPPSIQGQGKDVKAALELFDSLSITSAALPDNGGSVTRFVWLLPE